VANHIPTAASTSAATATVRDGSTRPTVLLLGRSAERATQVASGLRQQGCRVRILPGEAAAKELLVCDPPDAAILLWDGVDGLPCPAALRRLKQLRVPVLVLGPARSDLTRHLTRGLWDAADATAHPEEIFGRICTLARLAPQIRRLHQRARRLKHIGRRLQTTYTQIDNELLLAGQLQRDFLPKELPGLPGLRFATLMRPCSWVSGDTYDVFRVDEEHVAFYVADAVGHGVAAGLLTMFIKQALVPKQVIGNSYRILSPAEVLHELNQSLAAHDLPNCQYVTICYGLINFRTLKVQVARAGHPAPILVEPDGRIRRVDTPTGCLIGIFPDMQYSQTEFDLPPARKLIIFSDGLAEAFGRDQSQEHTWQQVVARNAHLGIAEMFEELEKAIDQAIGSLHPGDDITALGIEATVP